MNILKSLFAVIILTLLTIGALEISRESARLQKKAIAIEQEVLEK